jgi:hypothetical protein
VYTLKVAHEVLAPRRDGVRSGVGVGESQGGGAHGRWRQTPDNKFEMCETYACRQRRVESTCNTEWHMNGVMRGRLWFSAKVRKENRLTIF